MEEIASPVDLKKLDDARIWASEVMEKRPYRTQFFAEFEVQLKNHNVTSILELGSGPGFLAVHLLNEISGLDYTAYDFSEAMHYLAKERLGLHSTKVNFVLGDFKEENWHADLGKFSAVITLQAVHEVRHKDKSLMLFKSIKNLLKDGGIFLYCDHFYGESGMKDSNLYMSSFEQEQCLEQSGFLNIKKLLSIGTLNLWFAITKNI